MTAKAELAGRLLAEEARMQRLQNACAEFHTKHKGTPAAFDFNSLKHAVAGRDPILEEAAAALTEAGAGEVDLPDHPEDFKYAALLRNHDYKRSRWIVVPEGQSLEMADTGPARPWLEPYLGKDWHLFGFVSLASPPPVQPVVNATISDETKAELKAIDDAQKAAAVSLAQNPPIFEAALTAPPSPAPGVMEAVQASDVCKNWAGVCNEPCEACLQPAEQPDDMRAEAREWLIRKNGYFYRPNRAGYTMEKAAAGRYTKTEAECEASIEPENFTVLHESEVPDAPEVVDLKAEADRLRQRVKALEADAARYQWLREHDGRRSNRWPHVTQYPYHPTIDDFRPPQLYREGVYKGEYLDEAIDAGMKATPQQLFSIPARALLDKPGGEPTQEPKP